MRLFESFMAFMLDIFLASSKQRNSYLQLSTQ